MLPRQFKTLLHERQLTLLSYRGRLARAEFIAAVHIYASMPYYWPSPKVLNRWSGENDVQNLRNTSRYPLIACWARSDWRKT